MALVVALVCASPSYAQKPLTKPEKPTQAAPAPKSSSSTTSGRSSNKSSSTSSSTQSSTSSGSTQSSTSSSSTQPFTSSSSSTQQSQTSSSSSQLQTNKPTTGYINGHEWVDLGLSVKWATCNVGSSSPSDYGNYYAWGETRTKLEYTEENSVTYGKNMESIAGSSNYDAARANWGGTWRQPTKEELDELVNKCKWQWAKQGGHNGYKVTGPNGNSIFLPVAGWRNGMSRYYVEDTGYYWSATPSGTTSDAYSLYFDTGNIRRDWLGRRRIHGQSVRPVSE